MGLSLIVSPFLLVLRGTDDSPPPLDRSLAPLRVRVRAVPTAESSGCGVLPEADSDAETPRPATFPVVPLPVLWTRSPIFPELRAWHGGLASPTDTFPLGDLRPSGTPGTGAAGGSCGSRTHSPLLH